MQVEYKTDKGTVLFVLPDKDAFDVRIRFKRFITWRTNISSHIEMFDEGITAIGFASEITEEQANIIVDPLWNGYMNYELKNKPVGNYNRYVKPTASDSFKSIMQYLQVYEVNPFKRPYRTTQFGIQDLPDYVYEEEENAHDYGESRTGKWLVLFKPN